MGKRIACLLFCAALFCLTAGCRAAAPEPVFHLNAGDYARALCVGPKQTIFITDDRHLAEIVDLLNEFRPDYCETASLNTTESLYFPYEMKLTTPEELAPGNILDRPRSVEGPSISFDENSIHVFDFNGVNGDVTLRYYGEEGYFQPLIDMILNPPPEAEILRFSH